MENPKRKRSRSRIVKLGLIAVVVIAGLLIVWSRQSAEDEPIIQTEAVDRGTVTASVSATGVLQPLTTVEVKSNVGGQVVHLAVDEGDVVKAGQLIARIDPSDTLASFEQSQADLAAANSKVDQAREQLQMQDEQNTAQIDSARSALASARTRLVQAEQQAKVQPKLTQESVKQAESALASAQASLRQTRTALVPQKAASARAGYNQAKAAYDQANSDLARKRGLLEKGFVSKSQVEAAEEQFESAKAQMESAKSKLDTVEYESEQDIQNASAKVAQAQSALEAAKANRVQDELKRQDLAAARASVRQSESALRVALSSARENRIKRGDVVQANAQVQRSQAAFRNARTQLGYTTIVAPRDGIVTKKYVEAGSIVTAGRSSFSGTGSGVSLVDIADTSRMFALVDVDETDIAQIEIGQEVDATVDAYPVEIFTGRVTKIAPQTLSEQSVVTVPVTVEIELPDQRLKPGMSVTCDFIVGRVHDVLMVPSEAVTEDEDASTVTVMRDGKQITRKVEIGLVGSDSTEIRKGLKRGEKVVTAIIQPTTNPMSGQAGRGFGGMGGGMGGGRRRGF